MNLKILIIGRNRKIAADLRERIKEDRKYSVIRCKASKEELFNVVPVEMPHVIIICLQDETRESVKMFNLLKDCINTGRVTIMVVARDDDKSLFMKYTSLERIYFLSRPVSMFALYEKLGEVDEELSKVKNLSSLMMTEFVNPNVSNDDERRSVLVIDDDPQQLARIKANLKEFYHVSLVRSGEAAFHYLTKKTPDIILLDYMMPEMDGPEVMRQLKESEEYCDIPVIFLTGMTERDKVVDTLVNLKPQGYIVKPAKKVDIVTKIIEVMDAWEMEQNES
ncbi:MAG: response regulator [Eubacterium sp.]|nr:response regulator [Eubacterium sp.]